MSEWKNFGNYKKCIMCGRLLAVEYEKDYCEGCEERKLFKDMREYIRLHDVTEYKLAEIFKVPHSKVHGMIESGDIEYTGKRIALMDLCARCGAPISFGTLCRSCMRLLNRKKEGSVMYTAQNNAKHVKNRKGV